MNRAIFLTLFAITLFPAPSMVLEAWGKDNVEEGAELFLLKCVKCHGIDAEGEDPKNAYGGWKKNGKRIAPALNGTAHSWNHSTRELFSLLKNGSLDRSSSMRSHLGILSEREIISVIQYIKSLWPEEILKKHHELYGPVKRDTAPP